MVHSGPEYTKDNCPLCAMKVSTPYKLIIVKCSTHKDCWMLVWGEHTGYPSKEDKKKMLQILEIILPNRKWRVPRSIPEHWHFHECK